MLYFLLFIFRIYYLSSVVTHGIIYISLSVSVIVWIIHLNCTHVLCSSYIMYVCVYLLVVYQPFILTNLW